MQRICIANAECGLKNLTLKACYGLDGVLNAHVRLRSTAVDGRNAHDTYVTRALRTRVRYDSSKNAT